MNVHGKIDTTTACYFTHTCTVCLFGFSQLPLIRYPEIKATAEVFQAENVACLCSFFVQVSAVKLGRSEDTYFIVTIGNIFLSFRIN